MTQTGRSLLRSIQNDSTPIIDLFIREGIQNSLDAALNKRETDVDIITGSCKNNDVNKIFTGLESALKEKMHGNGCDFIAIKDKLTTGLTGPLCESDLNENEDFGNLRKLVYEICKPQPLSGKGGSWGLGKTVYFRMGIGLVIYYSRIKNSQGKYESRMAAALVEDESKRNSLLRIAKLRKGKLYCGVAWWGEADGSFSKPITRETEIKKILSVFSIAPYDGTDTGTCIIIPYINRNELAKKANQYKMDELSKYSLEDFIKLSVLRWYIPRLFNSEFNSKLHFCVNGKLLKEQETEIVFEKIKQLHKAASLAQEEDGIKIIPVNLRSELGQGMCAGHIAWKIFTKNDLEMTPPNNSPSPYALLKIDYSSIGQGNVPIVCFCRNAGMIINYETESQWTSGIPYTSSDEYLLAFFCLNADNTLINNPDISLEEYIRQSEPADHMSWNDQEIGGYFYRIVSKISRQVASKVAGATKTTLNIQDVVSDAKLQKMLGEKLLPPIGFGRLPGFSNGGRHTQHVPKPRNATLKLNNIHFLTFNTFEILFSIDMNNSVNKDFDVELYAKTSVKNLSAIEWESDEGVGKKFPFSIQNVKIWTESQNVDIGILQTKLKTNYGVMIHSKKLSKGTVINGQFNCICFDNTITFKLGIQEANNE